jgi:hypothetical protein
LCFFWGIPTSSKGSIAYFREDHFSGGRPVDVAQVSFIAPIIVDTALGAIDRHIGEFKVLVHCNQGLSRSPSIALLYLLKHTDALGSQDPAAALLAFRRLYPPYAPAQGMADYVRLNWAKYLQDG